MGRTRRSNNLFIRWSRLGVFNRILAELTAKRGNPKQLMIDATHLKAHRTAASLLKKGCSPTYRAHQRRVELQTACCLRWSLILFLSEMSDYKGAAQMLHAFPKTETLLADKGYDADWFRDAFKQPKITASSPSRANRKVPIPHDPALYKKRHKIENMFSMLKDWRRIHTRYDGCAHTFFSSICIAATVIFWL